MKPKRLVPDNLPVLQPGERELFTVSRHPIGILAMYSVCGTAVIAAAVLAFGLAPAIFSDTGNGQLLLGELAFFIVASLIVMLSALILTKIYWGNSWTLTTDSLTQINRTGLFTRQSSQLSLMDLEDVSSEQNGILTRMFNFGLLRVETAGEQGKFIFPFCPNPNYYAAQILAAREKFEQYMRQEEAKEARNKSMPGRAPRAAAPASEESAPPPPIAPPVIPAFPFPSEPRIDSYEVPEDPGDV